MSLSSNFSNRLADSSCYFEIVRYDCNLFIFTYILLVLWPPLTTTATEVTTWKVMFTYSLFNFQNLSEQDLLLLTRILTIGLVDADPTTLQHLREYRDLRGSATWHSSAGMSVAFCQKPASPQGLRPQVTLRHFGSKQEYLGLFF